jgi:dCTP deaminase
MSKRLVIHPILSLGQINGVKIDLRMGNTIHIIKRLEQPVYNPWNESIQESDMGDEVQLPIGSTSFILHPGDFALAPVFERVHMPDDLVGRLDGRSSLARLGIVVHATAGTVDPGFSGRLVCELSNLGRIPVSLVPLMRIAAISFERLRNPVSRPYGKRPRRKYSQVLYTKLSQDYEFRDRILKTLQEKEL